MNFINDDNKVKCIKDLERLLGDVRKIETRHKNRIYKFKTKENSFIDNNATKDDLK